MEAFAAEHFSQREILAVHVRGSDKVTEVPPLDELNERIFDNAVAELRANPRLWIFLLTDDARIFGRYMASHGSRVITTDCLRTGTQQGLHYTDGLNRRQLGIEVLRDIYLAARCDRFIGLGLTSVSNMVLHLKQWPNGTIQLVGPVGHCLRNFFIHS